MGKTRQEVDAMWRRSPRGRYFKQRQYAQKRGIPFTISFDEWWGLWEPHWANRGPRADQFCMARTNDEGAYALGNVRITTNKENNQEMFRACGADNHNSKLCDEDVPRVLDLLTVGAKQMEIARWMGINQAVVSGIKLGKHWKKTLRNIAPVIALALTGCASTATVYEISAGMNLTSSMPWSEGESGGFEGGRDVVRFAVRNESPSGLFVEFAHQSHLSTGWPVNSEKEDWLDAVSVGFRFKTNH